MTDIMFKRVIIINLIIFIRKTLANYLPPAYFVYKNPTSANALFCREAGPEPQPIFAGPSPTAHPEVPVSPSNIKNYQPINPNIPDVPPPPLPMRVGPKKISSG